VVVPLPAVRELFRVPRWALLVGVPLLVLGALVGVWAVDNYTHRGRVARNVSVAGETVGGMSDIELMERIDEIAERVSRTPILIETADGSSEWTAGELGIGVDTAATFAAVKDTGSSSSPLTWFATLNGTSKVEVLLNVDLDQARDVLQATDVLRTEPVEPTIETDGDALTVIPGLPGQGIDVEDVIEKLPTAVDRGGNPIVVQADLEIVPTRLEVSDLEPAVAETNAVIARPIVVQVNEFITAIPPDMMASWYRSAVTDEGAVIELDVDAIQPDLEELMQPGGTGSGIAAFDIVDGDVEIVSSNGGTVCCAPNAPFVVLRAMNQGLTDSPHVLPTRPAVPREGVEELEALGIIEQVATFTTHHPCCQSRVDNIQRFADLVRGAVILPGESLSLNEHVGRRTRENGFVAGGFISRGVLVQDIGGGVSQFATTIFNTAFFAGLDFDTYQAHSIYFSRYPYGREATISFPVPDLKIHNSTEYGVLIWTSYTPTSITVDMYSTKHIDVVEDEPRTTFQGQCRRATTRRTRTYADGREVVDSVFAVYRPGEGLNCDGSASDPSLTSTTTTTLPDTSVPPTTPPSTTAPPTTPPPTTAPPTTTTAAPPTTGG